MEYQKAWKNGKVPPPPVTRLIGSVLSNFYKGYAEVDLEVSHDHHNPFGMVQGGLLCTLADVAMGVAAATTLEPGEGFTTLNLNSFYYKSISEGHIHTKATVIHRGNSTMQIECDLYSTEERIARINSNCILRKGFNVQY